MARKISWSALKERQSRLNLPFDWIEETDYYVVKIFTLNDDFETVLGKGSGSDADTVDFENNFKNTPKSIALNDALNVNANINSVNLDGGFPCPIIEGSKWRTSNDTSDIPLSTSSFTQLKQLNNGVLHSFICDLSTDRVDFKVTIDGVDIINVNIDDLEAGQGGSIHGQGGGILCVKTGSKVHFTPPCGLTYSTLTISAQAEQSNKKMSNLIINYSVS